MSTKATLTHYIGTADEPPGIFTKTCSRVTPFMWS